MLIFKLLLCIEPFYGSYIEELRHIGNNKSTVIWLMKLLS